MFIYDLYSNIIESVQIELTQVVKMNCHALVYEFLYLYVLLLKKNYYEIFNEGNLNNKYFGVKAISGEDKP